MKVSFQGTKSGALREFEVTGKKFRIERGSRFSNIYIIGEVVNLPDKPEFCSPVAFAIWTAPRNEFAISSLSEVFIPYGILIHELRAANKNYLERGFGE
jgi:hypothetical protein